VALAETGLIGVAPAQGELGLAAPLLVAPGDAARSMLLHRVQTLGDGRMPPVGSNLVDEDGVALLEEWIRSLRAD